VRLDASIAALRSWGEPAYREDQLRHAVTRYLIADWDEATTLPKALRARLAAEEPFAQLVLEREERAADGTIKAVFRTRDGFPLETVLMVHGARRAVCLSSQSGCALACTFCATGTMGLGRNLDRGEILEQLLWAARIARTGEGRIGNVVMMGMGEPFMNYDEVLAFCRLANDPRGFGLGARSIAISTAGWIPGIDRLAAEPLQIKLALSLHAANDELRTRLMPVTKRYPLDELMAACLRYREATRRRIFIEYLLLDHVNDGPADARELARLLARGDRGAFHVNLIVYNPTSAAYRAADGQRVRAFQGTLEQAGVAASLRRSHGQDIDAACGQLAVGGARERRRELARERRAAPEATATVGAARS
jgi:23S rRNA (adenine2503-C2)-methyltransferase